MKKIYFIIVLVAVVGIAATTKHANLRAGFINGTPEIKSISAMAFGTDGILFIGDAKSATVFAIDTKDTEKVEKAAAVDVKKVDQKIASALGTTVDRINVTDLAVNPVSKKIYCSVEVTDGTPVLLKIEGDKISSVSLKDISYSSAAIANAPAEDAKDQRGRPLRISSISDIGFFEGNVLVSGLSNQEFKSTFRSIPFPFTKQQDQASLEIYHAAHKQYETMAPIRTFTAATINGKKYLIASYTCTPLVLFPLEDLKPGTHVKGRTIAEMGAGNSPLDMITMTKGGENYLIMSNSSRPVFKVNYKNIEKFQGSLTTPVEENFGTAGVNFISLPIVNVLQLDKLDESQIVMLQRKANGDMDLYTAGDRLL
ncbi:hypothetical protein WSM22_36900 [Cytophagales bacterium WSM2-2]|nr:hypothetical protein WSM22_36900 [Cytophagales bacterium WSM2-2]